MTTQKKKPELIFMPGCFDSFEGDQAELDELIAEIQRLVDSGELLENSVPMDVDAILDELSDEEFELIMDEAQNTTKHTLQ